jgi:outer membrane lipoprotein-sorting protein
MKFLKFLFTIIIFLAYSLSFNSVLCQEPEALNILKNMVDSAQNVKTIQYEALMSERIGKKMVDKTSFFKININPFKLYVRQSFIGITIEGIFNEGFNNNKLLVTTIGFPWIQINLDPKSKRVRDNHHHTIYETGFNYFVSIIDEILKNHINEVDAGFEGIETKNGHRCYKIVITNRQFNFKNYSIKHGEDLTSIAKNMNVNDFMILEINPKIKYYNTVKPGQVILAPTFYARQMVLYLDKDLMLPVQIDIYDDKGLYAAYSYNKLIVNKHFAWNEFNTTFKGYHFR